MLTKDQILKKRTDVEIKTFPSKNFAGDVRFRRMNAAGHYAVESHTTLFDSNGKAYRDFTYFKQAMIAYTMVGGDDSLLFSPEDIRGSLSDLDRSDVDELFGFAVEMNPPVDDAVEDLEKNHGGSLSTD